MVFLSFKQLKKARSKLVQDTKLPINHLSLLQLTLNQIGWPKNVEMTCFRSLGDLGFKQGSMRICPPFNLLSLLQMANLVLYRIQTYEPHVISKMLQLIG